MEDATTSDVDVHVIDKIPKTEGGAVDKLPKEMEETNSKLLRKIENIPNAKDDTDKNSNEVLSKDEIAKFNRDSFEKKLDEVIKAHEAHHLSKETHFDPSGEHNDEYDHEVRTVVYIFTLVTSYSRHSWETRQRNFAI